MEPIYLYAALLDVLGYKQQLARDRDLGTLDFQDKLSAALKVFDGVNEAVFRVQAISDTIILTCTEHDQFPEFLKMLREVFESFIKQSLFVRGGVAYSRHFQSRHLTYSHAVARAYELESQLAVYPRIVIDKNIIDMYSTGEGLPEIRGDGLLSSENGVFFVDVLTRQNWGQIYEAARQMYVNSGTPELDEAVFTKHLRFGRYLFASPHAIHAADKYVRQIATA
jgi:hypothetical protein